VVATPTRRYTAEEDTLHQESQQPGLCGKFRTVVKAGHSLCALTSALDISPRALDDMSRQLAALAAKLSTL